MNRNLLPLRGVLVGIILLAILLSCAVNPVTGKRELMLLSEADELQLGQQTDKEVVQTYGIYDDAELNQYITELGKKLAALSHRPHLPYQFRVLDSPVINAFAVPGGYIYITRGILAYLDNEAELAGVMGHEIGHVAARHSAKQYSKAQLAQLGLGLGSILSDTFRRYAGIAQFGVGLLFLKFSRDNERESDRLGVEYATRAGYDASQMANFFRILERMTPEESRGGLPDWFSTHPNPEERVATIERLAAEWRQKVVNKTLTVNRDVYLKKIDGIVFGDDPRQGYVRDQVFYHPDLRFQFPAPVGWKLQNTPSQVQMSSPDEKAIITLTLETGNNPTVSANQFVQNTRAQVVESTPVRVAGLAAHRVVSEVNTSQGVLAVFSYFIHKDNFIYTFHGITYPAEIARFQPVFQFTMENFRQLDDPVRLNVTPDRVVIKQTPVKAPLKEIFAKWGIEGEAAEKMALMNGRYLDEEIPANFLLKIVQKGNY